MATAEDGIAVVHGGRLIRVGTFGQMDENAHIGFVWSIADLLRGDYKQSEYGRVILPFVVLRRLDAVLEPTKKRVVEEFDKSGDVDVLLRRAAGGLPFYNTSRLTFRGLLADAENLATNLRSYVASFSQNARDVMDRFKFDENITRLDEDNLLYLVVAEFAKPELDLHPERLSNVQMGHIFEELIRKFSEQSNETAGEHFTPREVIKLMVNLLFVADNDVLAVPGKVKTLYDPACGTGGMLSVAEDHLRDLNPDARLEVFGQELNDESYAVCVSDMLLKGQNADRIACGNTLTDDAHRERQFDYLISNPPFGVDWKKIESDIRREHRAGNEGRFGAGLPPIDDGAMLFLQHMMSKARPAAEGGSRVAIVFNGSPLFSGAAEQGMNAIRTMLIEQDLLEAVIALPDQLFYNTGIFTYIWILTNAKHEDRAHHVQLIDARDLWGKMPRSLGDKRKRLTDKHISQITEWYGDCAENEWSKTLHIDSFGYHRITVEQPLRQRYLVTEEALETVRLSKHFIKLAAPPKKTKDPEQAVRDGHARQERLIERLSALVGLDTVDRGVAAKRIDPALVDDDGVKLDTYLRRAVWKAFSLPDALAPKVKDKKGFKPDPDLRDYENVPFSESIEEYFEREVLPQAPEAWMDLDNTKVGYEIPFTRIFYRYSEPRRLEEIDHEIAEVGAEVVRLLGEVQS